MSSPWYDVGLRVLFPSPLSFLGSVNGSYWGSFCLSAALHASVQISPASTFNTFVSTIRLGLWMVCHNQSWLVKSLINECLRQGFRLICMVDRDFLSLWIVCVAYKILGWAEFLSFTRVVSGR